MPNRILKDWTLIAYQKLCKSILSTGYEIITIRDHLREPRDYTIIFRHDVDRFPNNAIHMAEIENSLAIQSTYYIRKTFHTFHEETIGKLDKLGHEIGYHYEVMHKTRGDIQAAVDLFVDELSAFRRLTTIDTTSAHGSPLSRWNNLELWTAVEPLDFGLLGDAYTDIDYSRVGYYTDTGRTWADNATNLRDRVNKEGASFPVIRTIEELIELINAKKYLNLCIQTHPERWNESLTGLTRSIVLDFAANSVKLPLRQLRAGT